jgi:AbrB family looped-hinge helix DNA binding protein
MSSSQNLAEILGSQRNKSQKIRALAELGMSTRQVADALGVSFQHAYNVLHYGQPAQKEIQAAAPEVFQTRVQVGEGGRIVIPAAFRTALGLKTGDDVLLRLEDGELRIFTPHEAIRKAQELLRPYLPTDRSLADELIAERRAEAARE